MDQPTPRPRRAPLQTTETRVCKGCGVEKLLSKFPPYNAKLASNTQKEYRAYKCRDCYKATLKRSRWAFAGVTFTLERYDAMFAAQGGVCAICEKPQRVGVKHHMLCVDHDHATGEVRGLLCHHCNRAMGLIGDTPELLERALAYLLKHDTRIRPVQIVP